MTKCKGPSCKNMLGGNKKICFPKDNFYLYSITLLIVFLGILYITNKLTREKINQNIKKVAEKIRKETDILIGDNNANNTNNANNADNANNANNANNATNTTIENYENNMIQEDYHNHHRNHIFNQNTRGDFITDDAYYPPHIMQPNPRDMDNLDRIYNPLRRPERNMPYYDQSWYPNLRLPYQVIGCGGRNGSCMGGTQIAIASPSYPLYNSNRNIAPVNIETRGPIGKPVQVGIIYKIKGNENDVKPLYGYKKYPNDSNNWRYYTMIGKNQDLKANVIYNNRGQELNTNDNVRIEGLKEKYRVTMYEYDYPTYIPYV